jgi:hypothetical protein
MMQENTKDRSYQSLLYFSLMGNGLKSFASLSTMADENSRSGLALQMDAGGQVTFGHI